MAFKLNVKGEVSYLKKPEYLPIFLTFALEKNPNKFLPNYDKLLKIKGGNNEETNWNEAFKKRRGTLPDTLKNENLDWNYLQKLLLEDLKMQINTFQSNWTDYLRKIKNLKDYFKTKYNNNRIHKNTKLFYRTENLGLMSANLKINLILKELNDFYNKLSTYEYDESTTIAFKTYMIQYLTPRRYLIIDNDTSFYDLLTNGIDFYPTYKLINNNKNQKLNEYFKLFEESKELIKLNLLNDLKIDKLEQEELVREGIKHQHFLDSNNEKARIQIERYANASDKERKLIAKEPPLYENVITEYEMRTLEDEDYAWIETCREVEREKTKKDIKNKELPIIKNQRKNTKKTIKRNRK